jgi:twinkle protein
MELSEIKKALASRAEEVCRHLLPSGALEKNEWKCGDLHGSAGKSLGVVLTGEKAGLWRDFAGDVGGSNLLELWLQVRGVEFQTALNEAKEWLAARGVAPKEDLRKLRQKTYQRPSLAGIKFADSKVEFYLTNERQIPKSVMQRYKIASLEGDDVIVFPYLSQAAPHLAEMVKFVKLERDERGKKVSWTSKDTAKVLFGKHTRQPGDRHLLVAEGEVDAMTWASVLGEKNVCCTSVPFGAKWEGKDGKDPNSEWIDNDWEFLHSFERVYLSMDMDEEGRRAQDSIVKRLGRELCYCVKLPTKDANELLQAGRDDELLDAYTEAKTSDPAVLKNAGEFKQKALDRLYAEDASVRRGIPLPFGQHPFHLRWHEWTVVTGMNSSGKTTLLNFLLIYLAKLGYCSTVASLEVPTDLTLSVYVPQATGQKLPPREQGERAIDWAAKYFWFYDIQGTADLDDLLATFKYAFRRYGCRFFMLDSWMRLGINKEDLDAQDAAARKISDFVKEYPVHVFVVAHPRKAKNEIERIGKMDIKGSGGLTDEAHNVGVVRRNKAKEREIERMVKFGDDEAKISAKRRAKPDCEFAIEKQRNDEGDEPLFDLWLVKSCKQFFGAPRETGVNLIDEEIPAPIATPPAETVAADESF